MSRQAEVTGRAREMLSIMVQEPGKSGAHYATRLGASSSNAIQLRNKLRLLGLIEKKGDGRACTWVVTPSGLKLDKAGPGATVKAPTAVVPSGASVEPPRVDDGPSGKRKSTKANGMRRMLKRRLSELDEELLTTKVRVVEIRASRESLLDELEAMDGR